MRLNEVRRLSNNIFRVTDNCGVVEMLLGKLVQYCSRYFMFVRQSCRICVGEKFFVKRQRSVVDISLRLLQVGLRALHDLFHRHVRRECELQLLSKLLGAQTEIPIGLGEQIDLQPSLLILQRGRGFFLQRREILLHLWHLVEQGRESFVHEIDGALRLLNRRLGVNTRRMLQIGFRLGNDARNFLDALAQIWGSVFLPAQNRAPPEGKGC
jgi:hypothetical protein